MRFVVIGAGAIGGVVGGRLFQTGHDVMLVARGRHGEVIRERGLTVSDPVESVTLDIPSVSDIAELTIGDDDVVLLAVKGQDTLAAMDALVTVAGPEVPVVCLQNGVANERVALRWFANVYGCAVLCPTVYLEPGEVRAHSAPLTGILDVGRFPSGVDDTASGVAAAFAGATFAAVAHADVMSLKYQKLLANLKNAVEALCGPGSQAGPVNEVVRTEGAAVYEAAGIRPATFEETYRAPLSIDPVGEVEREGGSTYQSVLRKGSVETDYLNGEIVLLGREHGVPTPANETICSLMRDIVAGTRAPASISPDELLGAVQRTAP